MLLLDFLAIGVPLLLQALKESTRLTACILQGFFRKIAFLIPGFFVSLLSRTELERRRPLKKRR
jgi:hypothetical protein